MSIFTRLPNLETWRGWRALLVCFVSGALMALAFAPFHVWPVIFISLPLFYKLLDAALDVRRAALRGFFFGYGYFMAGTYWIANALLVDVAKFGWMIPLSILGLSAIFALWFMLFGMLVHFMRCESRRRNLIRFAVLWVAVEYLRSVGILGFPWNLAGYIALASTAAAQMASIIGTFGLSFVVLLVGLSPLLPGRRVRVIAPVVLIAALYGYGAWRLPAELQNTSIMIRVVQANIPQTLKWTADGKMESLQLHAEMTRAPAAVLPDIVVWSETAFPYTLHEDSGWPARLATLLQPSQILITGAVRQRDGAQQPFIWNSIVAIDAQGIVQAQYDKHQLVPFGEFVPLRHVLPLDKITPGDIDFSRGEGAATIGLGLLPSFSPLVCYEVIFPWLAVSATKRPNWLVNATNDGWYGDSPGPYQHYDMARMRAIEQGLPLVRAANTGISGVIDPYGQSIVKLNYGERGVIDTLLPMVLPPTFYNLYGELIPLLVLVLALAATWSKKMFKENK